MAGTPQELVRVLHGFAKCRVQPVKLLALALGSVTTDRRRFSMRDTAEILWSLAMFGCAGQPVETAVAALMKRFRFLARSSGPQCNARLEFSLTKLAMHTGVTTFATFIRRQLGRMYC